MKSTYKIHSSGTYYHQNTSDEMITLLEKIRQEKTRCRFHWGNTETGEDWKDDYDVVGRISRSSGPCKIPILVHNKRSLGGRALPTDCIVKITTTAGKKVLYQHTNYHK